MRVSDLLAAKSRRLITTSPRQSLFEVMRLLIDEAISCLPVLGDDGRVIGIISDKDVFRAVYVHPGNFRALTVEQFMTTDLIIGVPDDDISYIAGLMTTNRIRHIPIMDNGTLAGLISVGDIVKTQMRDIEVENRYLWSYINGSYPG